MSEDTLPNISLNEVNDELRAEERAEEEEVTDEELRDTLAEFTFQGEWDDVVEMYRSYPQARTVTINDSGDTPLHVAIDLDVEIVVSDLVKAIIMHEEKQEGPQGSKVKALEMKNERGDTPLHVAASRGFAKLCMCIIGDKEERLYLRSLRNNEGETPLFLAALNWNKEAFAYLSRTSGYRITVDDLIREDGDSILHCAIRREYFDLAVIITQYFDSLSTRANKKGFTPLKVLATRPSAFRSGIKFSWWKLMLYHCILVEPLDAKSTMDKISRKMMQTKPESKFPNNYATLCDFAKLLRIVAPFDNWGKVQGDAENASKTSEKYEGDAENPSKSLEKYQGESLPPNYATIHQIFKSAYMNALGLSGVALAEVRKTKKKHQWSRQLLEALMKRPYEAFSGKGGDRPDPRFSSFGTDMFDPYHQWNRGETSGSVRSEEEPSSTPPLPVTDSRKGTSNEKDSKKSVKPKDDDANDEEDSEEETEPDDDPKETPFLVAAENGIVEMVIEIWRRIPSAIHNTNSKRQNVLLVAVKHRQPHVVEILRMSSKEIWSNLIAGMDRDENTALHLAAKGKKRWPIAGSALQMMWDIKWFQYIKSVVPHHCYFRSNKRSKIAWEIFEESHEELVEKGSEWLKDTSESCSVVAALVAGVSFATASAVPGGTNDEGKAPLEGQPAFDAFAIASLVGLSFSVTGLIMFLSILTSRKEAKDFRRGLPLKLLLGLSSLFVSIIAMFVSFCSGHFFIINHKYEMLLFPFYAATSIPVAFYALAQFPLYFDLLRAIIAKVPGASGQVI